MRGHRYVNRRSTRFTLSWLGALAAVIAISGCSISSDDAPRALAVATTTTEAPSTATSGGTAAVLYYVRDGKLVPVTRSLPDRRIGVVLNALLQSPDQSATAGGRRHVAAHGNHAEADHGEREHGRGRPVQGVRERRRPEAREEAIAQLVMTATEFPDMDSMRFTINDKPSRSPRGPVATPRASATATSPPCWPPDDAQEAKLPTSTIERLNLRRQDLAKTCPDSTRPPAEAQARRRGVAEPAASGGEERSGDLLVELEVHGLEFPHGVVEGHLDDPVGLQGDHVSPRLPAAAASAAATPKRVASTRS